MVIYALTMYGGRETYADRRAPAAPVA
jgi:hypothetical protein